MADNNRKFGWTKGESVLPGYHLPPWMVMFMFLVMAINEVHRLTEVIELQLGACTAPFNCRDPMQEDSERQIPQAHLRSLVEIFAVIS